jgi:ADP-heptose:LPS heptosyltransferase
MKTALVCRYGAFGDGVIISPIFRQLKNEGYAVTAHLSKRTETALRWNPFISSVKIIDTEKALPKAETDRQEYWKEISKPYDKFINFTYSLEETLLFPERNDNFYLPKEKRHEMCNKNYYDYAQQVAGYDVRGKNGELFFSRKEIRDAEKEIKRLRAKYDFVVMWSMSGSSFHKIYPYIEYIAKAFLYRYTRSTIITVGDFDCKILEWDDHPDVQHRSGVWGVRKSMLMTKYVDLVIGSETGILNASGCYDTPKIVFLSHSTHENLSKYWKNVYPLHADVPCYPCHQLHIQKNSCPLEDDEIPICMDKLDPWVVHGTMEEVYYNKKYSKAS